MTFVNAPRRKNYVTIDELIWVESITQAYIGRSGFFQSMIIHVFRDICHRGGTDQVDCEIAAFYLLSTRCQCSTAELEQLNQSRSCTSTSVCLLTVVGKKRLSWHHQHKRTWLLQLRIDLAQRPGHVVSWKVVDLHLPLRVHGQVQITAM